MIAVKFRETHDGYGMITSPEPNRTIAADEVSIYEGWATFSNYVAVEGEKYRESVFVEAIRLDKIDSIVRVDP